MTRTEAKQALIAALSDDTPFDFNFAADNQPRDKAARKALIDFIRSLDTLVAFDLLTDAVEQVTGDACEDSGEFAALETVALTDADKRYGWVSPFNILDTARAQLVTCRDDDDHPANREAAAYLAQRQGDLRTAQGQAQ
jgi:hypothetical protein